MASSHHPGDAEGADGDLGVVSQRGDALSFRPSQSGAAATENIGFRGDAEGAAAGDGGH